MEEAQKSALRKCRVRLVQDLSIDDMLDSVKACSLFTSIMLETIEAKESRPEKVRTFLDYLQRRGPDAFDKFLHCLRESHHDFLVSYVLQEYQACQTNQGGTTISQGQSTTSQCQTQGSLPHSIYITQETQIPGDVEMVDVSGEDNSADNTMEVSTTSQLGIQESQSNSTGASSGGTYSHSSTNHCNPPGTSSLTDTSDSVSNVINTTSISHRGYSGNYTEEYRMESSPRGVLLIINNKQFRSGFGDRTGTDVDCDKLNTLFTSLGFVVEVRQNLTALEIRLTLRLLSQSEQLSRFDSLAVALLTHGDEEHLYGVDGQYIKVNEAFESFTAENCQALHHKPKLFIINACRGDAEDRGSLVSTDYESTDAINTDTRPTPAGPRCSYRIPNMKDFLVAYSTIPGHVSWRHMNDGSFFIQGFVSVFEKYAHTEDVLTMLVKVNNEVSRKVNHQGVQIPGPQFMLTKKWYLNPIVNRLYVITTYDSCEVLLDAECSSVPAVPPQVLLMLVI